MNMQFEHMPNDDRTDPLDGSRPWGRLTAKTNAGTSVIEVTLWPDGAHVLNIPGRRANLGAVVTAAQLAEFARMVVSTAEWCARCDATEIQHVELAAKAARIRASSSPVASVFAYGPAATRILAAKAARSRPPLADDAAGTEA